MTYIAKEISASSPISYDKESYTISLDESAIISGTSDGEVLFNDSGSIGGDPDFTFDKSINTLSIDTVNAGTFRADRFQSSIDQTPDGVITMNASGGFHTQFLNFQQVGWNGGTIHSGALASHFFFTNDPSSPYSFQIFTSTESSATPSFTDASINQIFELSTGGKLSILATSGTAPLSLNVNSVEVFSVDNIGNAYITSSTDTGFLSITNDAKQWKIQSKDIGTGADTFLITDVTSGALTRFCIDEGGQVGIGLDDPQRTFHITSRTGNADLQLTGYGLGSTSGDGMVIQSKTDGSVTFWNFENSDITFATSNTSTLNITSSGSVRVLRENSYLGVDASNPPRAGLIKKSGWAPILGYGSSVDFIIAQSDVNNIEATNTYTPTITITSTGNVKLSRDDTYFGLDTNSTPRMGFVKKTADYPTLAHGSTTDFTISRASANNISASNSYVTEFIIDNNGNGGIYGTFYSQNGFFTESASSSYASGLSLSNSASTFTDSSVKINNNGLTRQTNDVILSAGEDIRLYTNTGTSAKENFILNTSGNLGIGGVATPSCRIHSYEDSSNETTAAGMMIEQDGTGDAVLSFVLTGARTFMALVDNSDSDKFKICYSSSVGNVGFTMDGTGLVGIKSLNYVAMATGTNAINMPATTNSDLWINHRMGGGSPNGRCGSLYSNFSASHYFLGNVSGTLVINYSTESSDNPDYDSSTGIFSLNSSGDLSIDGDISAANIDSGTYTPTYTNTYPGGTVTSNGAAMYTRIGDIVHIKGSYSTTMSSSDYFCVVTVSLPISSDFTADSDSFGVGNCYKDTGQDEQERGICVINASASSDVINIQAITSVADTQDVNVNYSVSYIIK